MTVEQLAEILNQMVKDGKGDYKVDTYDWVVGRVDINDTSKCITLTMGLI